MNYKKGNFKRNVGVRVTEELYQLLNTVCANRGEDVAGFIRRSILKELASLSFLSAEQKKALGVPCVIQEVKALE